LAIILPRQITGGIFMANMKGPRFKQCRRLGLNVCGHPKAMKRADRTNARDGKKLSSYGTQLLEKQRLRAYYGVMEKQFRRYVKKAIKADGLTGDVLVTALETRLDNLVYRMGYAASIRQARQMVVHGHMLVNGKKVDRPSYAIAPGDVIGLREKSKTSGTYADNFKEHAASYPYIERSEERLEASLSRMPERSEVPIEIQDHLVVEFYSQLL